MLISVAVLVCNVECSQCWCMECRLWSKSIYVMSTTVKVKVDVMVCIVDDSQIGCIHCQPRSKFGYSISTRLLSVYAKLIAIEDLLSNVHYSRSPYMQCQLQSKFNYAMSNEVKVNVWNVDCGRSWYK